MAGNTSGPSDTVNVHGNSGPLTISSTAVTIGDAGSLNRLQGPIQIGTANDSVRSQLIVNDVADPASRTVVIDRGAASSGNGIVSWNGVPSWPGQTVSYNLAMTAYVSVISSVGSVDIYDTPVNVNVSLGSGSAMVPKTSAPFRPTLSARERSPSGQVR